MEPRIARKLAELKEEVLERHPYASFVAECPACGGDLYVVGGRFETCARLEPDGFNISGVQFDTSDEEVLCYGCKRMYSLDELTVSTTPD